MFNILSNEGNEIQTTLDFTLYYSELSRSVFKTTVHVGKDMGKGEHLLVGAGNENLYIHSGNQSHSL